jgi:tetratricopeptide (TPR) repeat protein/O-antigen ligase
MRMMKQTHSWRYLIQEAALIPLLGYTLLIGATLNGLAMYAVIRISLILLGVIGGLWLGWCSYRRKPFLPSPLQGPLLGLLAAYGVTTLTSIDPRRSLNALWLMGLYVLTFALVSDLLAHGWPAELFVKSLLIVGSILLAYGILQLVLWERQWLEVSGGTQIVPSNIVRLNPFLTNANMVAVFVNLLLPLALVGLLTSRSTFVRVAIGCYLACAGTVVVFTLSRAGWLGSIASLGLTVLLWLKASGWQPHLPRWRWSVGRVALLLVVFTMLGTIVVVVVWVVQYRAHAPILQSRQPYWLAAWHAFADSPLVGSGPDTYATSYMKDNSVPPEDLYVRAHSAILHLATETGLIGLAAGVWVIAALIRATFRRWQMVASTSERFWLSGLIGSLAGCAVHSLLDTPLAVPSIALTLALLLALLVTPTRRPAPDVKPHPWWNVGLAVLWLSLMASGIWMQYAYAPFLDGTALANMGDYQRAAPLLDEAVRRDPSHALYNLQAGFVYGYLAASDNESGQSTDNESMLDTAIMYYETGVAHEPAYSLNHANLASLYWARGDSDRAVAEMMRATQLAPREATYPLNLGIFYEQSGREQEAMAAYSTTLSLRPTWANAYFWRSTPLRREIHAQWQATRPVSESPSARAAELIELLRYAEAERELETALFVGGWGQGALQARFLLGELAYRTGDVQAAIAHTEEALKGIRYQSIFGPGTYGTSLYGWAIFYRMGLVADMLPQLATITYTDEIVDHLIELGGWYEQVGDVTSAKCIYREVLAAAPDAVSARQRLSVLEIMETP